MTRRRSGEGETRSSLSCRLWSLFASFFKISSLTVGGGYAMIPVMEEEFVNRRKWIDEKEISEVLALAQTAPGVIAINVAVYIGNRVAGVAGAVCAALGVILPSLVVITVIAAYIPAIQDKRVAAQALAGVRAGVCALILLSTVRMSRSLLNGPLAWGLAVCAFVAMRVFRVNPVWAILGGGTVWLLTLGRRLLRVGRGKA